MPNSTLTLGKLGTRLLTLLLSSPGLLGRLLAVLLDTKHHSFAPRGNEEPSDLLPLPVLLLWRLVHQVMPTICLDGLRQERRALWEKVC